MVRSPVPALVASLAASFAASFVSPALARAQTQPPPGYVPLLLQGGAPGMSYELAPDTKNAPPIAGCAGDCLVYVPPGKYRLTVGETLETRSGRRTIDVYLPMRAYVEPRTKADKESGLIMGIAGSAMFVGGVVGLAVSLAVNTHCGGTAFDGGRCRTEWTVGSTISLLAIIGGAVLSPIGWVQFGRAAPTVTSSPLGPAAVPPPRLSFDVVPLRRANAGGTTSLSGGMLLGMIDF